MYRCCVVESYTWNPHALINQWQANKFNKNVKQIVTFVDVCRLHSCAYLYRWRNGWINEWMGGWMDGWDYKTWRAWTFRTVVQGTWGCSVLFLKIFCNPEIMSRQEMSCWEDTWCGRSAQRQSPRAPWARGRERRAGEWVSEPFAEFSSFLASS